MPSEVKVLAENLRIARARQHVSLQQLSQECGVSISTLSFLENGKTKNVRYNTLYKIAQALDVSVRELTKDEEFNG